MMRGIGAPRTQQVATGGTDARNNEPIDEVCAGAEKDKLLPGAPSPRTTATRDHKARPKQHRPTMAAREGSTPVQGIPWITNEALKKKKPTKVQCSVTALGSGNCLCTVNASGA